MKIKYIFCISTGRCGTEYLASLLGSLSNCNSFHEQKPLFHNEYMRSYLKGNKEPIKEDIYKKIKLIKHTKENNIYSDTTHMFIKGFGWEIPNFISQEEIGIVILKRDKEKVVQSTFRVHSGPFSYLGRKWIITPNRKNIVIPPVNYYAYTFYRLFLKIFWKLKNETATIIKSYPKFFKNKSLLLLRWYYNETYKLAENYKENFPKINYITVNLVELNTINGFEKIIKKI